MIYQARISLSQIDEKIAKLTGSKRLAALNPRWYQIALFKLQTMRRAKCA